MASEAIKGEPNHSPDRADVWRPPDPHVGGWKRQALTGLPDVFSNGREQIRQQADAEKDEFYNRPVT